MARSRTRGASAVEYSIILVLVTITGVVGYKTFGKKARCLMMKAGTAFQGEGSASGGGDDCDAPGGGDSGGGAGGPVADNSGPSTTVNCNACSVAGKCFVAGTPVLTEEGTLPIEAVTAGMRVWTRPDEGGAAEWKPVARTFMHVADSLIRVTIADDDGAEESLELTPGHRVQVQGRGWVDAATLAPGQDRLVDAQKRLLAVVAAESLPEGQTVFNFEVEDDHTYFVGTHAVWVHNDCFGDTPIATVEHHGILPPTNAGNNTGTNLTYHHVVPRNQLSNGLNNIGKNNDLQYIAPALHNIVNSQYPRVDNPSAIENSNGQKIPLDDIHKSIDNAAKSKPHDSDAIDVTNRMYQWMPGDIVHGPSGRADDPGAGFDRPVKPFVPDKHFETLEKLNDKIAEYNRLYGGNMTAQQLRDTAAARKKLAKEINDLLIKVNNSRTDRPYQYDPDGWKNTPGGPIVKPPPRGNN